MRQQKITLLGTNKLIEEQSLSKHVYKALPWRLKFNRHINREHIRANLVIKHVIYHPFWIAKTLVIADRKPFSPKKSPNMIFIDGVSYYRGLFANIPDLVETTVNQPKNIIKSDLQKADVPRYVRDVQFSQINRTYLLKKPRHEIVDYFITYLPLWVVELNSPHWKETFYINANTGEHESHLSKLWYKRKKLTI